MTYKFILNHEIIRGRPGLTLYTGNSASYRFEFAFDREWAGLQKFAAFSDGENTYISPLIDNRAEVPSEFLQKPGSFFFGVYATADSDEIKRVSSNIVNVTVLQGAYSQGTKPSAPTKDLWESLISKSAPIIGDNGNWLFWNFEENKYVDSGKPSTAQYNDEAVNRRITALAEETANKEDKTNIAVSADSNASITLSDNTEVRCGELTSLTVTLPETLSDSFISSVVFKSGATATTVTVPSEVYCQGADCKNGAFLPKANKRYTMIFSYDGIMNCYIAAVPIQTAQTQSEDVTEDEVTVANDESVSDEPESVTETSESAEEETEPNEVI